MVTSPRTVGIVGGGPAASTLATLLARDGRTVGVYYRESSAPITVGESLVPGVVPVLDELGVEDTIAAYSRHKPGASFYLGPKMRLEFRFDAIPGPGPGYAYNVPRDRFNRTLRERAQEAGARLIPRAAGLEADGDTIRLDEASLEAAEGIFDGQPDLIVDATGRTRLVAELLDLPAHTGSRNDLALFTHFDTLRETREGIVYTDLLDYGWCWRIPLNDRVSFGLVIDKPYARQMGETPEEKLERMLESHDRLQSLTAGSRRLEPVLGFDNYQLVSEKLCGPNWVLLGDAGGFVDPVFSTGLYISMEGARRLGHGLTDPNAEGLRTYRAWMQDTLSFWMDVVENFYNGRLMTLLATGEEIRGTMLGSLINGHMEKHMGKIFTGLAAGSAYSRWLLRFMMQYGLKGNDPDEYRIKQLPEA